jgi:hypothetical protein
MNSGLEYRKACQEATKHVHGYGCTYCWPRTDEQDREIARDFNYCVDNEWPAPQEIVDWYEKKTRQFADSGNKFPLTSVAREYELKNWGPMAWNRSRKWPKISSSENISAATEETASNENTVATAASEASRVISDVLSATPNFTVQSVKLKRASLYTPAILNVPQSEWNPVWSIELEIPLEGPA